jgi:hypothetical protein
MTSIGMPIGQVTAHYLTLFSPLYTIRVFYFCAEAALIFGSEQIIPFFLTKYL